MLNSAERKCAWCDARLRDHDDFMAHRKFHEAEEVEEALYPKEFTAGALPLPDDYQRPGKKRPDTEITVRGNGGTQTLLYCHSTDVEWILEALRLMNSLETASGSQGPLKSGK